MRSPQPGQVQGSPSPAETQRLVDQPTRAQRVAGLAHPQFRPALHERNLADRAAESIVAHQALDPGGLEHVAQVRDFDDGFCGVDLAHLGRVRGQRRCETRSWRARVHRHDEARVDLRQPLEHALLAEQFAAGNGPPQHRQGQRLECLVGHGPVAQVPGFDAGAAQRRGIRAVEAEATHVGVEPRRELRKHAARRVLLGDELHAVAVRQGRRVDHVDVRAPVVTAAAGQARTSGGSRRCARPRPVQRRRAGGQRRRAADARRATWRSRCCNWRSKSRKLDAASRPMPARAAASRIARKAATTA